MLHLQQWQKYFHLIKALLSTNCLKGMTWFITREVGRVDTTTPPPPLHKNSVSWWLGINHNASYECLHGSHTTKWEMFIGQCQHITDVYVFFTMGHGGLGECWGYWLPGQHYDTSYTLHVCMSISLGKTVSITGNSGHPLYRLTKQTSTGTKTIV